MSTTLLIILYWFVIIGICVRVIYRRLPVGTTFAWIIVVNIFPFVGAITYFMIGDHRIGAKRGQFAGPVVASYQSKLAPVDAKDVTNLPELDFQNAKIAKAVANATGFNIQLRNDVSFMTDPDEMFESLIKDIKGAQDKCMLAFYIVHPEGRVVDVLNALIDARARGVECMISGDSIGSSTFFKSEWPKKLKAEGITVVESLEVGLLKSISTRTDLRNHRKIVIIDTEIAYTGSFNLADPKFFKADAGVGAWIDLFVRFRGDIVSSLACVLYADYALDHSPTEDVKALTNLPSMDIKTNGETPASEAFPQNPAQVIPSGPGMKDRVFYGMLIGSIYGAKESIYITTPYLIPDEPLIIALRSAARTGVKVTIIVPKTVDSFLTRYASQSYFSELLTAGIEIHQFPDGLLHSKIVLIDDGLAYVGTVNFDMRSFNLNQEVTVALHEPSTVKKVAGIVDTYLEVCEPVDADAWIDSKRRPAAVFFENSIRLFAPLL